MDEIIIVACTALVLIGMVTAIMNRDPFDKLISLSVMVAGVFPFIIDRGFLDISVATALIIPLSTIFILMVCPRGEIP